MKKVLILAALCCAALFATGCNEPEEAVVEQAPAAAEQPSAPAAVPAPIVDVTDTMVDEGVRKALVANGETLQSARALQVGEALKHVCGLPTVTVKKGDTIWSICKAALRDPVATELAATKARRAELVRESNALAEEKAAIDKKLAQTNASWKAADDEVHALQARIDARPAPTPQAPAAAAPSATGQPATKAS